jgi:hypothetical protein
LKSCAGVDSAAEACRRRRVCFGAGQFRGRAGFSAAAAERVRDDVHFYFAQLAGGGAGGNADQPGPSLHPTVAGCHAGFAERVGRCPIRRKSTESPPGSIGIFPDRGASPVFVSVAGKGLTSRATDCAFLLGIGLRGQLIAGDPRPHP